MIEGGSGCSRHMSASITAGTVSRCSVRAADVHNDYTSAAFSTMYATKLKLTLAIVALQSRPVSEPLVTHWALVGRGQRLREERSECRRI